ncbi:MAG: HugZ family protein [Arenibacterium sp.]
MVNPIRPTDNDAIEMARALLSKARWASLGVLEDDGFPSVTRIGLSLTPNGMPVSLVSDLSAHTKALKEDARCSLLIGAVEPKGDPLNQPRLTLKVLAEFVRKGSHSYPELAQNYLVSHPKAKLYIDFADFSFLCFEIQEAALNGGFGKAYLLSRQDLFGSD